MPFNLDTLLLKSFAAIAETGSFSRAAEIVGRSQSAVSLQIKKLEDPNYEIKIGAAKGFAFMGICDELGQLRLQCSADNCLAPFKDDLREICSAAWNGSTLTPPVVNNNAEKRAADK